MPIIDIPFKRVAIDIVGEIFPASSRGHRYILTVVDFATRYPEAVALKNITTTAVAEALVSIFARVGVLGASACKHGSLMSVWFYKFLRIIFGS